MRKIRSMERAGSEDTFKVGREDLRVCAGIRVSPKDVERVYEKIGMEIEEWSSKEREELINREEPVKQGKSIPILYVSYDGTGAPMVPGELSGRKGKQPDGSAKTREVKLGCVFTQTTTDENGRPAREQGSTTFVGAIETAEKFGKRLKQSGMEWTVRGANAILSLRRNYLSARMENFREARTA